jgi:HNH endonuclease/NUMOD3 motif
MNYLRIYQSFIASRRGAPIAGYFEDHHILPKSQGGTDDADNIVRLSADDHLFAHILLARVYPKQRHALALMLSSSKNKKGKELRRHFAAARSSLGLPNSPETNAKISAALSTPEARARMSARFKGGRLTDEHRSAISRGLAMMSDEIKERRSAAVSRGARYKRSDETRARMSAAQKGHAVSDETRAKMSAAKIGKKKPAEFIEMLRTRIVSEETRLLISLANKNRDPSVRDKLRKRSAERGEAARFLSIPYRSTSIADVIFYRHCLGE